ncbi:MAG: hypothetical protein AB7P00_10890 [Sandaracinaceae bacterium]
MIVLKLSKPSVVVVRMANKNAVARIEYTIEAFTNSTKPTTVSCLLPEEVEMENGAEELVPSIISNSASATLTIDGTAAASYISSRCSSIGCSSQDKSTIESGSVDPIGDPALVLPPTNWG